MDNKQKILDKIASLEKKIESTKFMLNRIKLNSQQSGGNNQQILTLKDKINELKFNELKFKKIT